MLPTRIISSVQKQDFQSLKVSVTEINPIAQAAQMEILNSLAPKFNYQSWARLEYGINGHRLKEKFLMQPYLRILMASTMFLSAVQMFRA